MDRDDEKHVKEFLVSLKRNGGQELSAILQNRDENEKIVQSIINLIEKKHNSSLSDSICEALFSLHSSGQYDLVIFTMQFIPALLWAYYNVVSRKVKWNCGKIEAVILSIYNEVVDLNEDSISDSFCIPSLTKPSIYHEPFAILGSTLTLTETAVNQHAKANTPIVSKGPTKHLERIHAGYRSSVTKTVLEEYNTNISAYASSSLISLCNLIIRLSCCGYTFTDCIYDHITEDELKTLSKYPRINLNSDVIKELVTSLRFTLYNGHYSEALTALRCLHKKALHSLCTAGILNTNALLNLVELATKSPNEFKTLPPNNPVQMKYRDPLKLSGNASQKSKHPIQSPTNFVSSSRTSSPLLATGHMENMTSLERQESNQADTTLTELNKQLHYTTEVSDSNYSSNELENSRNESSRVELPSGSRNNTTKNLNKIEDELIEISRNNDKTPLINGFEGKNIGLVAPVTKFPLNCDSATPQEETKM